MIRAALALALLLTACKRDDSATVAPTPPELAPAYFGPGSKMLTFDDRPAVQQAALELEKNKALHLLVIGRTDSRGGANPNMELGLKRAREMREAILLKAAGKVELGRVHIASRGQAEPTGDNNTEDGRAANRRVEFFFYYPDGTPLKSRFAPPIVIEGE
jgi:outer membrane protein OmpA-like peptidoglycan-associated protein